LLKPLRRWSADLGAVQKRDPEQGDQVEEEGAGEDQSKLGHKGPSSEHCRQALGLFEKDTRQPEHNVWHSRARLQAVCQRDETSLGD